MKPTTYALLAVALFMTSAPSWARPQQDQESVADAARKAQAAEKNGPKATKVFTNDDISQIKGSISVIGPEPEAPKPAAADATKTPAKGEAYWRAAFADARRRLADDAHELDILQREYNLKEMQYYSDPNVAMREQNDRKDLTDTKTAIDDKTAAVEKDKQTIADLEDALRQAGGDPGWATEPSTPPSDTETPPVEPTPSVQPATEPAPTQTGTEPANTQPATEPAQPAASQSPSQPAQ